MTGIREVTGKEPIVTKPTGQGNGRYQRPRQGSPEAKNKPGWYGVGQNPVDRRPVDDDPPRLCLACGSGDGPWAAARLCSECAGHGILPADLLGPR